MVYRIGLFILLINCIACKKVKPVERAFSEQVLPVSQPVSQLQFIGTDSLWLTSGVRFTSGEIFLSVDDGKNWNNRLESEAPIRDLCREGDTYYAITSGNVLYYSNNSGGGWLAYITPASRNFAALHLLNDSSGVMVGGINFGYGFVARFNPLQQGGFFEVDTLEYELTDLALLENNVLITAGYGVILRSTDQGQSWSQANVRGDYYKAIHFPTPQTGYVIGDYGSIWKTTDAGLSWSKLRGGSTLFNKGRLNQLFFSSAEEGVIVGDEGVLWLTQNGGASWEAVEGLEEHDFSAVTLRNGKVYAGTKDGMLITLTL